MFSLLCPPGDCCYVCGVAGDAMIDGLCDACRPVLIATGPRCRVCRRFCVDLAHADLGHRDPVCRQCRVLPPPFLGVTAVGMYGGLLRWSIGRLKGAGETWLAHPLGRCLAQTLSSDGIRVDHVVPVPAEPGRLRRRGYNPPTLLAAVIAKQLRISLVNALARKPGPPQTSLDQRGRWLAAAHGYRIRREGGDSGPLAGARILLLDDVITTGATVAACTMSLLQAGAAFVWCGAIADTPIGNPGRR